MKFICVLLCLLGSPAAGELCPQNSPASKTNSKELFEEAFDAGKDAGEVQWYVFTEIAEAQARASYYDDAIKTAGAVHNYPDQLFIELVGIRATNGDTAGAKQMADAASPDKLKFRADEAIAIAQANAGDFAGARETVRNLPDKNSVLEAIGEGQVKQGDLDGALKTASEMKSGWSDGVLWGIAQKLWERGDKQKAQEIARQITDPDMRETAIPRTISKHIGDTTPITPCALAWNDAKAGKYVDAFSQLRNAKCDCKTIAFVHEEAGDAKGASEVMHTCPNRADISAGMAELAEKSAERGDIPNALKFAEAVHITGASYEEGYLAPALRVVARAWAKQNLTAVIDWARARPTSYERAIALLGVAETIAPARSFTEPATH